MLVLKISGMSCSHCVRAVQEAIESVPGVTSAQVNLDNAQALVQAPESAVPAIVAAVSEEGYSAEQIAA